MVSGLPVIASAVGELPYSIQHGKSGLVVRPDDPEALAAGLETLLSSPECLQVMGEAARKDILDRFSVAQFKANGTVIVDRIRAASA